MGLIIRTNEILNVYWRSRDIPLKGLGRHCRDAMRSFRSRSIRAIRKDSNEQILAEKLTSCLYVCVCKSIHEKSNISLFSEQYDLGKPYIALRHVTGYMIKPSWNGTPRENDQLHVVHGWHGMFPQNTYCWNDSSTENIRHTSNWWPRIFLSVMSCWDERSRPLELEMLWRLS